MFLIPSPTTQFSELAEVSLESVFKGIHSVHACESIPHTYGTAQRQFINIMDSNQQCRSIIHVAQEESSCTRRDFCPHKADFLVKCWIVWTDPILLFTTIVNTCTFWNKFKDLEQWITRLAILSQENTGDFKHLRLSKGEWRNPIGQFFLDPSREWNVFLVFLSHLLQHPG